MLSKETIKLLVTTRQVIDKDKNSENAPKLELVEAVLMHCNVLKNNFQQAFKVLFTLLPNKQFGQLINILFTFIDNIEYNHTVLTLNKIIDVWFTEENSKPLEIENNVNITFAIG